MKKISILLLIGISAVYLSACSSSDKKTKEVSNVAVNEKRDNENSAEKEDSDEKNDVKKTNTFSISGWTEDILWGSTSLEGKNIIIDFSGKKIGDLEEGKYFKNTYIGDYAVMKDNTVIDKSGKVVFDLEKSEFDEIIDENCLEVGFLICAQKVNSFEETGLHYYAVNMSDGSSEEISLKPAPFSKEWRGKYYGNGFYSQGKGSGGFDTESFLYNITTNKNYLIYRMDGSGNKITEVKDIYWIDEEYSDGKFIYYVDDAKEADSLVRWKIELETGLMSFDTITDDIRWGWRDNPKLLMDGILDIKDSEGESVLYDEVNQIAYPMKEYASYTLIAHKGKEILITVKNEGGGVFFTVMNENGKRVFEPIACEGGEIKYAENYIMIKNDAETYSFFDWKGEELHILKNCKEYYALGDYSVLYMKSDVSEYYIFNVEEGKEYPLSISSNSVCMGFANKHYIVKVRREENSIYEGVLIDEKGEFICYEQE